MIFTTRFNEVLTFLRLNQSALAEKLNVSKQAISNLKSGASLPSLDLLIKMCDALDVSADYLLGRSDF